MSGFGIASEKVPTMKSLDADKKSAKSENSTSTAAPEKEEVIDFSKVKVEPLFEEFVDFDTFSKSDFRAVKVKACEAVKKSKKLLQFTLDDGTGTDRTILSGIHAYYEPEELVGKTLIAITTLAVNRRYKRDGEQEADFISCITFGKSAEFAQKYLHKGMRIVIGGRISTGSYKDKDGKTIYTTDVIVEEHEFAQNKDSGAGVDSSETSKTDKDGFMEASEGEIPFN